MHDMAIERVKTHHEAMVRRLHTGNGDGALPDDLVAAMSGDREFTPEQLAAADRLRREWGAAFFSQLLFAVTHQSYPEAEAEATRRITTSTSPS
jgi:hypothetical protein